MKIEAGQAKLLKTVPTWVAPAVEENRLNVSPTVFSTIPPASSSHGSRLRPASITVPPTTRLSNSRSPIG